MNRGAQAASGEWLLLLNPDTLTLPGSLRALLQFADAHPEYGVFGGRTLRPDGSVDPSSCWGAPTLWSLTMFATMLSTAFKRSPVFDPESLGRWQRDSVREVPIITGCLLLVRLADWERLGGMDEDYFLYGEDAEFSMRAGRAGLRRVVVPDAVIVHEVGGSSDAGGEKGCMVMAGKVTHLRKTWTPLRAAVGVRLLLAGVAVRAALEAVTRRSRAPWSVVWRRRADWYQGYPRAEETLFGRELAAGLSGPAEHPVANVVHEPRGVEVERTRACRLGPDAGGEVDRGPVPRGVVGVVVRAGDAVDGGLRRPADAVHDHGASGRHRLDRDDPEVLDGREDEGQGALEQRAHELVGDPAEHVDGHARVGGDGVEPLALGAGADDDDREAERRPHADDRVVALVRHEP